MAGSFTIWNRKGGSGKTTTAVNLSAALARLGKKVELWDLCPQGDASTDLGFSSYRGDPFGGSPAQKTKFENLWILPADPELLQAHEISGRVPELSPAVRGRVRVIDCPPSVGPLSSAAIVATRTLIVPVVPDVKSVGQIPVVDSVVGQLTSYLPAGHSTWVLLNQFDVRRNLDREIYYRLEANHNLLTVLIDFNIALREAPGFHLPVTEYAPDSVGSMCYQQLAREMIDRGKA